MTNKSANLWPRRLKPSEIRTPIWVLRRQAEELYQQTKGLLRGDLRIDGSRGNLWVHFNVIAPALGNYEFWILSVHVPTKGFPATLKSQAPDTTSIQCETLAEFEQELERILGSPWVIENVQALWGQSLYEG